MKKFFIQGIIAGILAAITSIIYFNLYQNTLGTSFETIINVGAIFGSSIFGCTLIAIANYFLYRFKKENLIGVLNILIFVFSFISIVGVVGFSLPLDIESPELFPGLSIPMHFFPALAYFSINPFFQKN